MNHVLRHLRRAALLSAGESLSDAQLLEAFLSRRDEAAFEVLLRRHGRMVLGVCRRVLRNAHDAEDAFQATFLVLSRKAGSIRSRQVVASWLYGVAYRTAMKARAMNARYRAKERQASEKAREEASSEGSANEELLAKLDNELSRLPDKYRVPVVLCELEGRSRKDVARLLGMPEGTLSWRLAQAKKLLAKRLSRHGAALSIGVAAAAMTEGLSPALRASTLKTVLSAGTVPAKVLALTEGVMKAMLLTKLKITFCFASLALAAGIGASGLTYRATAEQPRPESAYENRPQADELEVLRLEIEALRKSLLATRERVKILEDEVRTLKKADRNPPRRMPGMPPGSIRPGAPPTPAGTVTPPLDPTRDSAPAARPAGGTNSTVTPPLDFTKDSAPESASIPPRGNGPRSGSSAAGGAPAAETRPETGTNPTPTTANPFSKPSKTATDPLAHAENALKRLRKNPDDTQAVEVLERALKKLKEREKSSQGH